MCVILTQRGYVREVINDMNPYKEKDMPKIRYTFTTNRDLAKQFDEQVEVEELAERLKGEVVKDIQAIENHKTKDKDIPKIIINTKYLVLDYIVTNKMKIKDFNDLLGLSYTDSLKIRKGNLVDRKVLDHVRTFILSQDVEREEREEVQHAH
ncbi:hypothetical protein SAMN05421767_1613 [Granulicatella balaenopterae]|uniref:Uncharacterized protein n=1 Tax=Granulicatella balaenopterae TaxID=137733 RepID=A0A1H9PK35_9LACT|nr:hypothetical protein SAMN05421767_1613 [Granulicatella balaenopterae]